MKRAVFLFLLFLPCCLIASGDSLFHLVSLPEREPGTNSDCSVPVTGPWKYHKGDDTAWSNPAYDDSGWITADPSLDAKHVAPGTFENKGWFRIRVDVDTQLCGKDLGLLMTQSGASEIYLDGRLMQRFGKISADPAGEIRFDPHFLPVPCRFSRAGVHLIAVRYFDAVAQSKNAGQAPGFELKIGRFQEAVIAQYVNSNVLTAIFIFYFAFFAALGFLHFMLFLFYRAEKSNLYYSLFASGFSLVFIGLLVRQNLLDPDVQNSFAYYSNFLSDIYGPSLIAMLYSFFYGRLPRIFWLWIAVYATDFVLNAVHHDIPLFGLFAYLLFGAESLRVIIAAIIKKREGAWILGSGIITTVSFFSFFAIFSAFAHTSINFNQGGWAGFVIGILVILATLSIPISMSVYLARNFARTSRRLSDKLAEVEMLSQKTIEQEKEKQRILETQKETLELQVKERTAEITEQKKVIEEKNKDITDSINYAKRIQDAILPSKEIKYEHFPESFVLFRPKDIVSGDFYWFAEKDGNRFIASADCTGHGVPGALMSMIGNNILNHIVNEKNIVSPDSVLDELHREVRVSLKQHEQTETKDGMDIALCVFRKDGRLEFAGAQRPLWIFRNNGFEEIKGDKFSIGGLQAESERKFTLHAPAVAPGDCIYMFSDGFADQFGGVNGKKYMTKRFREFLFSITAKKMQEQESLLDEELERWKAGATQVDDVLVIGVRC
ncbi:MAG TPA: SpoIIE family protein phosphatase [Bacteroidia bacterium]|nr:SpoIIE family protein phosphatase [Bacteroidia bacterium]